MVRIMAQQPNCFPTASFVKLFEIFLRPIAEIAYLEEFKLFANPLVLVLPSESIQQLT